MSDELILSADVLVIGGGPAATWAALEARREGARVLLVDKSFCGSSGVAAAASVGHWWVPPDEREDAIAMRNGLGGKLSERDWMHRVLDTTWRRLPEISDDKGYPTNGAFRRLQGATQRLMQGPVYLREMRRRVSHSGVRILDHSPALELLVDRDGAVRGAAGVQRQKGRRWRASASAVVLATGGCAFKSGSLGSDVATGDGLLMAAEVGATLSGMEFSNCYGFAPRNSSMDKNGYYLMASFSDADGNELNPGLAMDRTPLIRHAMTGPLFAKLDRAPVELREGMRANMPNFFMVFDRLGIDPFEQRFEVEFINEGTVRGTGGVRVADEDCWSGVPGLWVAGDVASREPIVGSVTGAGSPNAAWTVSSGTWSGRAAARHALQVEPAGDLDDLVPAGRVGLRPSGRPQPAGTWRELTGAIQDEMLPLEKNGVRTASRLSASLRKLDGLWSAASDGLVGAAGREAVWARETAAMLAVSRWAYSSAEARTESRGMHVRDDYPDIDPDQRHRVLVSGVDEPVVEFAEFDGFEDEGPAGVAPLPGVARA